MAITAGVRHVAAPPLAPTGDAIDLAHLSRMTLGERALECEVLELFAQQTRLLLDRIRKSDRELTASAAHTLKGSARGIGAWRVALAAEAVEGADDRSRTAAVDALADAIEEARAAIVQRVRPHN